MSSRILAGRYELLEKIGDGGMAVVYKARCRLLNRFVAIKILKPEFTKDVKFIENFRRESQAAASLSHPNIVNIYDVGREGNIHYIVMELVEGEVLSDVIKRDGPMDWRRAIEITKQIASALSLAHKNHIIHRDVKPHNILITMDGVAKITDFGIAKALNSGPASDSTGTIMGSVHYFSPEQARGGYVDEKSDIYSLGIVLYEMLTGKVPFDGDNPVAVALMHINDEITPPSKLVSGIPPQLEQIVMKAANKYQVGRYASADEMLLALENVEFVTNIVGNSVFAARPETQGEDLHASTAAGEGEEEMARDGETGKKTKKDKNGKEKKKFRLNKVKAAAVVLALICAIPVSYLIVSAFSDLGDAKEVIGPNFAGMTLEEAKSEAEGKGLAVEEGEEVYSTDYEIGQIVTQDPVAEAKVKEGKTITVSLSKGAREGTVPNLVGKSRGDAEYYIKKYGYQLGTVSPEANSQPKDIVIWQSIDGGEEAAAGTTISLKVSLGQSDTEAIVPMVVGMELDAAKEALEKAGLSFPAAADIVYEMSEAYEKNFVMWQQYAANSTVEKGAVVGLKVSTGSEPPEPQPASLHIDYSKANNEVFYLTVTISDEGGTRNVVSQEMRLRSNGSEDMTLTGTGKGTVTVTFDNDPIAKYSVDFNTGAIS